MRKLVVLGGAAVIVAAAAACSSTPSTKSGTETITGTASGQSAATQLNSNNSTLIFQTFAYTGPVSTTVANYSLPGGNNNAKTQTGTLKTSVGNLTITHTRTYQPSDNTPPTLTGKSGNVCTFTLVGEKGTYVTVPASSTGQFKDATGHGNYVITINIGAALPAGKTTCNINDYGANGPKAVATGSSILFKASGPLTVTP